LSQKRKLRLDCLGFGAQSLSMTKKPAPFFIEWEDSYGCSSDWQEIHPEGEPQLMICHSFGWVIRQNKKCVVIVPHLSQNIHAAPQQGCGDMTIPRASIRRMTRLAIG
jgi:hypothetical protein